MDQRFQIFHFLDLKLKKLGFLKEYALALDRVYLIIVEIEFGERGAETVQILDLLDQIPAHRQRSEQLDRIPSIFIYNLYPSLLT